MAEDFDMGEPLPEESANRTFIMAAAGLGGLLILSMICLAVYALVLAPRQQEARATQAALNLIRNTEVAQTQTAEAAEDTPTSIPTITNTPLPTATVTPTQVVVLPSDTPTPTPFTTLPTIDPLTATAAAQATADAGAGETATATPTALPATGFADEAGIPTLILFGALLVIVVFVARGLRTRTAAG